MKTVKNIVCPACGIGKLIPMIGDYNVPTPDGAKLVVSDVPMEKCDKCGEITISLESGRIVQAAIADATEQLKSSELLKIRESLGVDQSEMSEVLGLGGKTYHRWEKGYQFPSRSMGYYLRVLKEFPEAFGWLKARTWRNRKKPTYLHRSISFPALVEEKCFIAEDRAHDAQPPLRFNPARALFACAAR